MYNLKFKKNNFFIKKKKMTVIFKYLQSIFLLAGLVTKISCGFFSVSDNPLEESHKQTNYQFKNKLRQTEYYDSKKNKADGTITLTPKSGEWEGSVLFLHDIGDKAEKYYEMFIDDDSPFPKNYKIILPQAKRKFYELYRYLPLETWMNINDKEIPYENTMEDSAVRLGKVIDDEVSYYKERFGEESAKGRVVCAGHGIGCIMTYYLGLTYPKPEYQKAIIGFSGEFLSTPVFDRLKYPDYHEGENFKLPMLLIHGVKDRIIPMF